MTSIKLPYGKGYIKAQISENHLLGTLESQLNHYIPEGSPEDLIRCALDCPIGTPRLSVMSEGKAKVVVIASDHTRPVPSKILIPPMLAEIRKGNPLADITILVATGCHRETTRKELEEKFGTEIVENETIVIHDCDDASMMVRLGILPSGGELIIHKLAAEADLLVSEGFIEPHFFAGFSGGRKSVLPGIASRTTVLCNHNAEFIAHPNSRMGMVEGNLIHRDMLYASQIAHLAFICNVVLDSDKQVIFAVAGDCDQAHKKGCEFLQEHCRVEALPADIVITTNGGYPLDQNIYQAVKGMTAAEATVRTGGVIIMAAQSGDGHGGDEFYRTFKEEKDLNRIMEHLLNTPRNQTNIDQWQSQIFARILQKATVIYISEASDEVVTDLHMIPAHSIEDALDIAKKLLGDMEAVITVIPDGVSVIV